MTRLTDLLFNITDEEFILADKGYIGEFQIITPFKGKNLSDAEKECNWWLSSIRWLVEHIIAHLKIFKCLHDVWRHDRDLHGIVFYVICEIVNIDMYYRPARK